MISAPKPVPNPYDLHCLQPGAEIMYFHYFFKKSEKYLKTWKFLKFKTWKSQKIWFLQSFNSCRRREISFFHFYEKVENSLKFIKLTKILEISINLVKKSSFLPEAETDGKTKAES